MKLLELFDEKYMWSGFEKTHSDMYRGHFETEDGSKIDIIFSKFYNDPIWEVEFSRDDAYGMTNRGDAVKIFATVLDAIQEFKDVESPEYLTFSSKTTEKSRIKFYDRLAKKIAAMGYENLTDKPNDDEYPQMVNALIKSKLNKHYMFKAK